jgi:uncharacterized protein
MRRSQAIRERGEGLLPRVSRPRCFAGLWQPAPGAPIEGKRGSIRILPGMEILEVKRTLGGTVLTFPCEAAEVTPRRAVLRYTAPQARRIADVELPVGTDTIAYYWIDRPYNVYHWVSPAGETLAWYFNVSGFVRIGDGRVEWEDLEVDVLVTPDFRARVLDEDRLPADLPASQRAAIAAGRARVLEEYTTVAREVEAASREFLR